MIGNTEKKKENIFLLSSIYFHLLILSLKSEMGKRLRYLTSSELFIKFYSTSGCLKFLKYEIPSSTNLILLSNIKYYLIIIMVNIINN